MEEGEANRSGTQGSTACTYGESGPSCRHPSRRARTHTRGGAAHTATQKQSSNKKRRSPHTTWIVGPREVQPISIRKQIVILLLLDTVIIMSEYCKSGPYKNGNYSFANGPSCGLGQSKTVAVPVPNDEGIPAVDEAESPVVRRGSAARGLRDEAVAEAPGPSRVHAFVLPACVACWHAWQLRWRPAREAPVRKTVAPFWHPHVRPSPIIGTPGRARRACALILWTEERVLLQVGQEDVNPPLAGQQGVAVLTSGRSSGGGGPSSSVGKGLRHRHRRSYL
ncbi:putative surface protease GP63 [Trypanosoma cruzi]|nr:putative surface protease GP63 [Trypanosoma cruzi]